MIINTEVRDLTQNGNLVLNQWGVPKRFLCVSYVNSDKKVKCFTWIIPDEMMYQWKYATKNDIPDPVYQSWDKKPVVKEPVKGKFTEQRIHELLLYLKKTYPDNPEIKQFDELYMPVTSFMDIEVDTTGGFPEADVANHTVNTCSFVREENVCVAGLANLTKEDIVWIQKEIDEHCKTFDTKYKFTYRYHPNEISLLNDIFFNFIDYSDAVSGWNWYGYDWPYLFKRAENLNMDISVLSPTRAFKNYRNMEGKTIQVPYHKCMYDYMEVFKKWDQSITPKESNKLDWVAGRVLGVKKVAHQMGFKEMWEQNPRLYVFYNAIDSILIREIDKKIKTSSIFFGLANLMHTPALTAFSSTSSIEIVDAEFLYEKNKVFPVTKKNGKSDGYEGAFVFEPIPNIYKNVLTLDYASLYPTTMRQFNISPDTFLFKDKNHRRLDNEIMCTNGSVYTKDFVGFIPEILTYFYNKRKEYKAEMKIAEREKNYLEEVLERRLKTAV